MGFSLNADFMRWNSVRQLEFVGWGWDTRVGFIGRESIEFFSDI